MLIAHIIDSLEVGGAEAVVAALSRLHAEAGHSVEVHCLMKRGILADQLEAQAIPVFVHGPGATGSVVRKLYRSFQGSRPNVVHCHNKTATIYAAAVARLAGARVVVSTRHGMAAPPYRLRHELKFWLTAAVFCDRVVAVCDTARRNMMAGTRLAARNVVTIRNGAYPSNANGEPHVVKRGFTLISVGRLAPAKNFGTLLQSIARARREIPDLALWILGHGDEAPALQQLSADLGLSGTVHFLGERTDVGSWLRKADLFVLSSISEGLPISFLEAMAAGLPAIVTNVGGMPELIELSGAGRVVHAGDADMLAAAIVELAGRRGELGQLGRRASECYQQHFTPERMAREYLTLYQTCES